ncbi:MAG: hypothetical protein KDA45_01415 [Planctomycetales bacterium]|nr:hypothetical protein [Planctomycetales bacterium]
MILPLLALLLLGPLADQPPCLRGQQLQFAGCFDIPPGGTWEDPLNSRFDYSWGTIAYREDRQAIYVATHAQDPRAVGLIQIPPQLSASEIPLGIQLGETMQLPAIPHKSVHLRGLFWDQPSRTLYYNYTLWYNVTGENAAGLGAVRDQKYFGLWYAGHNNATAGYITRDTLSGQLLIGNAVAQGISSLGPSAYTLQLNERLLPQELASLPLETLLCHPVGRTGPASDKPASMSTGRPWLTGMEICGGVCVDGTLIIAVDEGERSFYGTSEEFEQNFGFRPRSDGKGYHLDRYTPMLWLYSLAALHQAAQQGQPYWSVPPYEYLPIGEIPKNGQLGGLAYDAQQRRLFVSQAMATANRTPRLYAYQLAR